MGGGEGAKLANFAKISLCVQIPQVESELHRSAREIFAPLLKNNDGAVDPVIFADLVCDTCREIDHPDPTRAAADLREALIRLLGQIAPENWRLQQLADAFTRT